MTGNQIQTDQYRALFEQSADAILIIDGETFVDCNQATVDMLCYRNKEELLKTHPSELSPKMQPDGRESFEKANEMIAIAFERGSHRFEWDHKRADGEVFPVEVLLTAVPDTTSTKLHVVWRDITGKKQLESQLWQTQKIEAVGKLAGGDRARLQQPPCVHYWKFRVAAKGIRAPHGESRARQRNSLGGRTGC